MEPDAGTTVVSVAESRCRVVACNHAVLFRRKSRACKRAPYLICNFRNRNTVGDRPKSPLTRLERGRVWPLYESPGNLSTGVAAKQPNLLQAERFGVRPMTDYIQVVTTTERREDAERIARTLVEERLAACVQVTGPITSTYRWHGQIETAQECQCWAKTRRTCSTRSSRRFDGSIRTKSRKFLALPVVAGNADYLAWLEAELCKHAAH